MNLNEQALVAQERVITLALDILQLQRAKPGDPSHDASLEYTEEQLAIAARDLARATDGLPDNAKPVAWDDSQEIRDRDLLARHFRVAASANVTDWPGYLNVVADAHVRREAWYRP